MKTKIVYTLLVSLSLSLTVLAKAKPVTEDVMIKNAQFAEMIYTALSKNIKAKKTNMAGGSMEVIALGGFSCMKQDTRYSCALIADSGWNYMGMESYGSGSNEKLSEALFAGLGIEAVNEEGMFLNKAIALDVPDNDSGTERNQLACMKPIGDSASLGLRISCSLLNAL